MRRWDLGGGEGQGKEREKKPNNSVVKKQKTLWPLSESETNKLRQQDINLAHRHDIDLHGQLFFPLMYELPSLKDYSNHERTV